MLTDSIANAVLQAAASQSADRDERVARALDDGLDVGFLMAGIAAAVDVACVNAPLEASAVARATVLIRPEWQEVPVDDRMPPAWEAMAVHLAASMAGTGQAGISALRATSELGDGGRIALAGLLNPSMQTPTIADLEWYPALTYPPIAAIAMLNDSCSVSMVEELATPFTTGREDAGWVVAPFLGFGPTVSWPEWETILEWIGAEEPTGSVSWWTWLLHAVETGTMADVIGASGEWRDMDMWRGLVENRLGWLLHDSEHLVDEQQAGLPALRERIRSSTWPAITVLN